VFPRAEIDAEMKRSASLRREIWAHILLSPLSAHLVRLPLFRDTISKYAGATGKLVRTPTEIGNKAIIRINA
jgi:hypothetical protein